jgi:hypothetical protein
MGLCLAGAKTRAELEALKQLREAGAAHNEKMSKLSDKHLAEVRTVQQEINEVNRQRQVELTNLQTNHLLDLKKLQEVHMEEMRRLHLEHADMVRAELHRERSEKKAQQTHMNIAHERMGRNITELQQQLVDVQTKHTRLCPGGPDTQTATTKRMIKQMEDEMLQVRQNIAESHAHAPNFNTNPMSDAGDAMSLINPGMGSPSAMYGSTVGGVQQPSPIAVPAI